MLNTRCSCASRAISPSVETASRPRTWPSQEVGGGTLFININVKHSISGNGILPSQEVGGGTLFININVKHSMFVHFKRSSLSISGNGILPSLEVGGGTLFININVKHSISGNGTLPSQEVGGGTLFININVKHSMFVRFKSDFSISGNGFTATYLAQSGGGWWYFIY